MASKKSGNVAEALKSCPWSKLIMAPLQKKEKKRIIRCCQCFHVECNSDKVRSIDEIIAVHVSHVSAANLISMWLLTHFVFTFFFYKLHFD